LRGGYKIIGIGDTCRNSFQLKQLANRVAFKPMLQLFDGHCGKYRHKELGNMKFAEGIK